MSDYFKKFTIGSQFRQDSLPVDCIVLGLPESKEIGREFANLGIRHVVAFDLQRNIKSKDME